MPWVIAFLSFCHERGLPPREPTSHQTPTSVLAAEHHTVPAGPLFSDSDFSPDEKNLVPRRGNKTFGRGTRFPRGQAAYAKIRKVCCPRSLVI